MGQHHIIVGDAHSKPQVDNRRFDWLGSFVLNYTLDHSNDNITVIDMGDWEDMESLSSYDMGKKCYEGRKYADDLKAAHDARARFNKPIDDFNAKAKKTHSRRLSIRKVALGGNHFERRVLGTIEKNRLLEGTISVSDNKCAEYGWEYVPFLQPTTIDGITYVHYWQGAGTSQPIAMGKYPAQVLIREKHTSTVTGHNHILDVATVLNAKQERIIAISAGCYLDPEQFEVYAGQSNENWWRGIIVLKDVHEGYPHGGWEIIPIEELQKQYG
jgi:hypothetical protein